MDDRRSGERGEKFGSRSLGRSAVSGWLALAVAASLGGTARAESAGSVTQLCDEDPPCRSHRDTAMRQYEAKEYRAALAEFEAAYALRPEPRLLINIGRSLFRIARPRSALLKYEEYKRAVPEPDADTRAAIERYIKEAKATVGTFADSESDHPPAPPGAEKTGSTRRSLVPPILVMSAGFGLMVGGIVTGALSLSTASQFDMTSRQELMWSPDAVSLYNSGRSLDGGTAAFFVGGIVVTLGGGLWLGATITRNRAAEQAASASAPPHAPAPSPLPEPK